jgi:hypothetical protein
MCNINISPFNQDSFFLIVVLGRGPLWLLQKFLQYIKYIVLEFTPPLLSFILPSSPIHQDSSVPGAWFRDSPTLLLWFKNVKELTIS